MQGLAVVSEYCAEASALAGESIVGTAAPVRVWLAIEHAGAWDRDALASPGIPDGVRERIKSWSKSILGLRPQLIRRPRTTEAGTFRVYVVLVDPAVQQAAQFHDMTFETLEALDLPAVVASLESSTVPAGAQTVDQTLVLVCTHGKRDRCCAKRGTAAFERVAADPRVCAWQTTHLGGHRFAATCVVLPHGACYGRLEPDEITPMLDGHEVGALFSLDRYRGRGCWTKPGQAAVHFVRRETGTLGLSSIIVTGEEAASEGGTIVDVETGGRHFRVEVRRRPVGTPVPPSCGKPAEQASSFELVTISPGRSP